MSSCLTSNVQTIIHCRPAPPTAIVLVPHASAVVQAVRPGPFKYRNTCDVRLLNTPDAFLEGSSPSRCVLSFCTCVSHQAFPFHSHSNAPIRVYPINPLKLVAVFFYSGNHPGDRMERQPASEIRPSTGTKVLQDLRHFSTSKMMVDSPLLPRL